MVLPSSIETSTIEPYTKGSGDILEEGWEDWNCKISSVYNCTHEILV